MAQNELPAYEWTDGPIKVTLWERSKTGDGGRQYVERSFTIRKSWKKKDGGYEERSLSLWPEDVLKLIVLLPLAYAWRCIVGRIPQAKQDKQDGQHGQGRSSGSGGGNRR